ncbi:protein trichome birefringence-like 21 isoform X2 [Raphanus sativus]|uniref:Protein trichome birefringence-like 21 isoform X2 n=1 Tax=Raphanus sativus TaxID=3726 RepID=A0A6J0KHE8_RAPSA|nr:protein trichome birefringence-like 21 isoform X2 [Raphanus sativus]
MIRPANIVLEQTMELPLFAVLQRTPRVAVRLSLILFSLAIVPALYSLLSNPILLPLSISSPETDGPLPSDHMHLSHLNSPSVRILPPVNSPIPAPPYHTRHRKSSYHSTPVTTPTTSRTQIRDDEQRCDLFKGEWIPNEESPYYNHTTCWAIQEHQNCMKHGRPDSGFLRWRWKPDGCDLPVFDPQEFLEMVRGKSMGFVGDSISRNQAQSLLCLLSRVEYPEDISSSPDKAFKVWNYTSYNFTLHAMWSPFLVKTTKADPTDPECNLFNLYLDEYDSKWTSQINRLDYLVISSGHWFYRPVIFYENETISGCQYCALPNTTQLPLYYGYTKALRTSLRAILENFKGLAFLRSFSPQHFEGGPWDKGGDCVRTRPYRRNETIPEGADLKIHDIQVEEFRAAEEEMKKKQGLRLRLMDTTQAMLLRPDGHPGRYGHLQTAAEVSLRNDCIHWCLPGPIDTWNDILLQMMKTEK